MFMYEQVMNSPRRGLTIRILLYLYDTVVSCVGYLEESLKNKLLHSNLRVRPVWISEILNPLANICKNGAVFIHVFAV